MSSRVSIYFFILYDSFMSEEPLRWQGAFRMVRNRALKIKTPRGHGSGFYMGAFGTDRSLGAVATATHVIQEADEWGEPIKLIHIDTGLELLLPAMYQDGTKRPVITFGSSDLAVVIFTIPPEWNLPAEHINRVASEQHLVEGVEVGWFGFPGIKDDKLCFFHGHISTYLDAEAVYLVDGVAINGVSGGPLLVIDNNLPVVAGVVTAYIPNLATGQALPGMSMFTSISAAVPMLDMLRDLDDAAKKVEEQSKDAHETPGSRELVVSEQDEALQIPGENGLDESTVPEIQM